MFTQNSNFDAAISLVAISVEDWLQTAYEARAGSALAEIKTKPEWAQAMAALASDGGDVTDDYAVLQKGISAGIIKTAAQRNEEARLAAELSASTGGQVTVTNGVPSTVTMAQARIALQQAGMLQLVADGLSGLPDGPEKDAALTAWEYSPNVSRTGALVLTLGAQLGFTGQQLDDLFHAAGAINL